MQRLVALRRMRVTAGAMIAALAAVSPATAAVKGAAANGFEVESKIVAPVSPAVAYAMLGRPGEWWDPEHTYSHDARDLSLDLQAGGCFCERLSRSGGSVEHMRVVYAQPGAALRLTGGLGPLQGEGAAGSLTFTLKPVPQGTEISLDYIVGGYWRENAVTLAPIVDQVLAGQLERLRRRLATGAP